MSYFCLKFESWWNSMPGVTSGIKPRFVVDGQAPMRQCLHPEACNKDIELPEHYNYFHDLRKDFVECYSSHGELSTLGVQEMLQCILSHLCKNCQSPSCVCFLFHIFLHAQINIHKNIFSFSFFCLWFITLYLTSVATAIN